MHSLILDTMLSQQSNKTISNTYKQKQKQTKIIFNYTKKEKECIAHQIREGSLDEEECVARLQRH